MKNTVNNLMETLCTYEPKNIPVTSLYISPLNSGFGINEIDELCNSLKMYGLNQPLVVAGPDDEGRYEILSGARRFTSILKIRESDSDYMQSVPCNIALPASAGDTIKQLVVEDANLQQRHDVDSNFHRKKMIRLFKRYAEETMGEDSSKTEIRRAIIQRATEYFQNSERYSSMFLNIFGEDGNEDVEELLDGKQISVTQADKLIHMPEEDRNTIVEEIKSGRKAKDVFEPYITKKTPKEPITSEDKEKPNYEGEQSAEETGTGSFTEPPAPQSDDMSQKDLINLVAGDLDRESGYDFEESYGAPAMTGTSVSMEDVIEYLEGLLEEPYLEGSDAERLLEVCQQIVDRFA